MENNENNFQNEVNQTENNVNTVQENKKEKKSGKGKTIALMVVVLLLVLAVGVLAGVMFSGGNKTELFNKTEEKIANNDGVKSGKKIDESKPWVYDANYNNEKSVKTITNNTGKVYKSSETLKYPFINIDSEYAKNVNNELKEKFEKHYKYFGGAYSELQITNGYLPEISYEYAYTDKVLSVVIKEYKGVINGDATPEYYVYNFNLETLEKATLEDVYKECGFNSETELNEKIDITIYNAKQNEELFEDTAWYKKMYFIDSNSIFNIIVNGPATLEKLEIKTNVTRIAKKQEETQNQTTKNDEYSKAISEIKICLKDENWLKQNIYITKDEMIGDDGNIDDQQITFIVCKSDSKPIIVVETLSENARFIKIDLVTYGDNSVQVKRINQGHIYHGGYAIDANKCVVLSTFMHMGDNSESLRSITNGEINFLGGYGYKEDYAEEIGDEIKYKYYIFDGTYYGSTKDVTKGEYDEYKANLNEKQYKFVSINTELTATNVDKYIK